MLFLFFFCTNSFSTLIVYDQYNWKRILSVFWCLNLSNIFWMKFAESLSLSVGTVVSSHGAVLARVAVFST